MKLFRIAFVAIALALPCAAQLTTWSASHIGDGQGGLLVSGVLCAQPTGQFSAGFSFNGGQNTGAKVCRDVANGVLLTTLHHLEVGAMKTADGSLSTPVNPCYAVTVVDGGGGSIIGSSTAFGGYTCVQPSGSTFNFDTFIPSIPPGSLGQSITNLHIQYAVIDSCTGSGCGSGGGSLPSGSGNQILATPADGSTGVAALRSQVASDVPALPESKTTNLVSDLAATEKTANKGAASGYAPLDSLSQVPVANLPSPALTTGGLVRSKSCPGGQHVQNINTDQSVDCAVDSGSGSLPSGSGNQILATPADGSSGTAALRSQVVSDVPALPESKITNLVSDLAGKQSSLGFTPENSANKDANSGYAGLDSGGKLKSSEAPTWNQSTTGNSATATALAALGTACSYGYATGVDVHGNAICPSTSSDSDVIFIRQGVPSTGIAVGSSAIFVNLATGYLDCIDDDYSTHCMPPGGGGMVYPGAGVANSTGSAWGTSYAVGGGANDLVQLNGSGFLPALNGSLLTSLNASNIASGTLGHAYLPTLLSADIPNNSANTSGTAANLSGTPALPSGTTAATQSPGDSTLKIATDAFVAAAVAAGGGGSMTWPSGGAGIPNYSGASSWGTSYSASNPIPANFLASIPASQLSSGTVPASVTTKYNGQIDLRLGVCQGTGAAIAGSFLAATAPSPVCLTGTNVNQGASQFTATGQLLQDSIILPSDWSSGGAFKFDVLFTSASAGGSGNVVWTFSYVCAAKTGASIDPSFASAQTVSVSAGTNNLTNFASLTATISGCAADNLMFYKWGLDSSTTATGNENALHARIDYVRAQVSQ